MNEKRAIPQAKLCSRMDVSTLQSVAMLSLLIGPALAQTTINLQTQSRNPDFSDMPMTRPVSVGTALPPRCVAGQLFFNSTSSAGSNLFGCVTTNTWKVLGGYNLVPAGPTTLGAVMVSNNSGLVVTNNGALSANVGTGPGTLAAGDDARIVSSLQPTSLIPATNITGLARSATADTTSASNISSGTLSASRLPSSVVQGTQVNTYANQPAPSAPGIGNMVIWTDSTDKNVEAKNDSGAKLVMIQPTPAASHQFLTSISPAGAVSQAQPGFSDLAGALGSSQLPSTVVQTNASAIAGAYTYDFSGAAHTLPIQKGPTANMPSACTIGELYFATDATAGQQLYECSAANSWTQQLNSGGTGTAALSSNTTGKLLNNNGASSSWSAPSLDCSQFAGTDMSLRIQACLVALYNLNRQGGIADARNFTGTQTWSVNPFAAASLPTSGKLLLPPIQIATYVPVVMPGYWEMEGPISRGYTTQTGTSIQANASHFHAWANPDVGTITAVSANSNSGATITGAGTSFTPSMLGCAFVAGSGITTGTVSAAGFISGITSATSMTLAYNVGSVVSSANLPYAVYCPVVVMGQGVPNASSAPYQFGVGLRNLDLDCNAIPGCVGAADWFAEEQTEINHVEFHGYTNIGLDRETAYAQNSGPFHNLIFSPAPSCTPATINYVSRVNGGSVRSLADIGQQGLCTGGNEAVGFDLETPGEIIQDMHVENITNGIVLGSNVACPVACPQSHLSPHAVTLMNINGGGASGTTVVKLDNSGYAGDNNIVQGISHSSTWTNTLIDNTAGCTVPNSYLGKYVTDASGHPVLSTSNLLGCLSRPAQVASGWCHNALAASSTLYFDPFNTAGTSTCSTDVAGMPAVSGGTASSLRVSTGSAATGGEVVTVYINGSGTLTCTLGAGARSCSDTTHTAAILAGQLYYVKIDTVASEALANISAVFAIQ
jgi:hypothetical protein